MFVRLLAAIVVLGLATPGHAAQPSDASMQDLGFINAAAGRAITGYSDAMVAERFNAAIGIVADDPSLYSKYEPEMLRGLEFARASFAAAQEAHRTVPLDVPDLGSERVEEALGQVRPFLDSFEEEAARQLDLFARQMQALADGDLAQYDALVLQETDSTLVALRAENQYLEINIAAQEVSSPVGSHLGSTKELNNFMIALLELLTQYDSSTADEDLARFSEGEAALVAFRRELASGEQLTRTFCRQTVPRLARETFDAACGGLEEFNEMNRLVPPILEIYLSVMQDFADQAITEETVPNLERAEAALTPILERRMANQEERGRLFVQLVQELN